MTYDIDDAFEGYMREVNPKVSKTSIQYRESRRCFFAGAFLLFYWVQEMADKFPEPEAIEHLKRINQQFLDFRKLVMEDRD